MAEILRAKNCDTGLINRAIKFQVAQHKASALHQTEGRTERHIPATQFYAIAWDGKN